MTDRASTDGVREPPGQGPEGEVELPLDVVARSAPAATARRSVAMRLFRVLRFVPLVIVLVAVSGVVGLYFQPPGLRKAMQILDLEPGGGTSNPIAVPADRGRDREPAATARPDGAAGVVVSLGRLVPEGKVVTVARPFGAGDARIAELRVREGDRVAAGAVLAILDNEALLRAAVETAQADIGVQEARLAQSRAATRASLDEARAALARAQSAADAADRVFSRTRSLHERGVVSQAVLDDARSANDQAQREVDKARATLSRYSSDDIEEQVDVIVARRNLQAARADLARAEADLEKAYIRAPIAGTVLSIGVRPGEKPGAVGILNIGDIDRMAAELEVYQTQIGRVAVGDQVELTADALSAPLKGTVSRIGLEVGRQTTIGAEPAANTDARVVEVIVTLDEASSAIASRFTNLQVIARIAVGGRG